MAGPYEASGAERSAVYPNSREFDVIATNLSRAYNHAENRTQYLHLTKLYAGVTRRGSNWFYFYGTAMSGNTDILAIDHGRNSGIYH